ncbi:DUF1540 domain-containing protein [Eubacteriales bacterium OttesenSCG-928-M02]|nr:DUF1540 domain-containing protein [Eubacteriales bacterium OttesenSCG-928-M02]
MFIQCKQHNCAFNNETACNLGHIQVKTAGDRAHCSSYQEDDGRQKKSDFFTEMSRSIVHSGSLITCTVQSCAYNDPNRCMKDEGILISDGDMAHCESYCR